MECQGLSLNSHPSFLIFITFQSTMTPNFIRVMEHHRWLQSTTHRQEEHRQFSQNSHE